MMQWISTPKVHQKKGVQIQHKILTMSSSNNEPTMALAVIVSSQKIVFLS